MLNQGTMKKRAVYCSFLDFSNVGVSYMAKDKPLADLDNLPNPNALAEEIV
jgi:hypothetical protein